MSQLRIKPGQIAGLMDIIEVNMIVRPNIGSIVETGMTIGIPIETGMTIGISVETGMTIGIMVETDTITGIGLAAPVGVGSLIGAVEVGHLLQTGRLTIGKGQQIGIVTIVVSKVTSGDSAENCRVT